MLIIDSHLDLSWNGLQGGRDLNCSVHTLRAREAGKSGHGLGQGTVAFPEMRRGRMALCFSTLLARSTGVPVEHIDYPTPEQAYGAAQGQLAYYRALEARGTVRILRDRSSLEAHIQEWEAWDRTAPPEEVPSLPLGFVISMESADPIMDPEQLVEWYAQGIRVIGPAHYGLGRYAGGTSTELGLIPEGIRLIAEMQRLGIFLDLTHFSDQAFWQALDHYQGPVLASHNNCRALVPHQRQYSDEQIQAIIQRKGVIGIALDDWMLVPGWITRPGANQSVSLSNVVDHIDHICQLAGNAYHAAIGSDLDGLYGREQSPGDLDTIADLQKIPDLLAKRGYTADQISGIMYQNWLRLFRSNW